MGTDHERDFTGDGYAVRRSSEATSERSTRAACAAPLAGGRTGVRYVGNGTAVAGCEATRIRGELRILHPPSSIGEHGCRPSACRQIGKLWHLTKGAAWPGSADAPLHRFVAAEAHTL